MEGGTVARANKPPIYRLQCPRGHRFDSGLLSFPDPLPTSSLPVQNTSLSYPYLWDAPLHFLSKILHYPIQIKAKKPINNLKKKKKKNVLNVLAGWPLRGALT